MRVNNGAVASFVDTIPLLHPYGRLICHDLFVTDVHAYRTGFRSPGKIVSGGELRRDNDIDYFLARVPEVRIPVTRQHTDRPIKSSFTGPSFLSRRIQNKAYSKAADLVRALAHVLNAEARALAAQGGRLVQVDEPFLVGYPEDVDIAVEAINAVISGVDVTWGLHVCYGNRCARLSWERYEDLEVIHRSGWDRALRLGVMDVKIEQIESAELIAARIHWALDAFADKLTINPDCGLRHLPTHAARSKLAAMVEGTMAVQATPPTGAQTPPAGRPHDHEQGE